MILKLVIRNWKRNKAFAVISMVSLAIGIACTNMLMVFVIHEYTIESSNPNKERILFVSQDSPLKEGEVVSYTASHIPAMIREQFPEIENSVQLMDGDCIYIEYNNNRYTDVITIESGPSFFDFFPYEVIAGDPVATLQKPDGGIITETFARKLFGNKNPLHETLTWYNPYEGTKSVQIGCVIKEYPQSLLTFDLITGNENGGGTTLLLMNEKTDTKVFGQKLKNSEIPAMTAQGNYYVETLQEIYFNTSYKQQALHFMNRRDPGLVYIGILSAILILLIACFNYINLNFSRILQQLKLIHTEQLMGAGNSTIRLHLFTDTCLMVLIAFLLSLLLIFDLLPLFNSITSGRLSALFFFDKQVLPALLCLILFFSIIPAWYFSRKLSRISLNDYRVFFIGRKKRLIVSGLVVVQLAFSISLILSLLTVRDQLSITTQSADKYDQVFGIGDQWGGAHLTPLYDKIKSIPGISSISAAGISPLHAMIEQFVQTDVHGAETYFPLLKLIGDKQLLETLHVRIEEGMAVEEAINKYNLPVYLNRKYCEKLIPTGENPLGKPLSTYYEYANGGEIIAGIIEDFPINSLEDEIMPMTVEITNKYAGYLLIRLDGKNSTETLKRIQQEWDQLFPGQYFMIQNLGETFKERNQRIFDMANLLLMYSLISIFLTAFGLFGISLYATNQRLKEIVIRKVNGATTWQIWVLLHKPFLYQILLAFIVILPVTWHLLRTWLQRYTYHTEISFSNSLISLGIVFLISLLTISWHSYKAARINPAYILKSD